MSVGNIGMTAEIVGKIDDYKRKLAQAERETKATAARINSTKAQLKIATSAPIGPSALTGLKNTFGEGSGFGLGAKTLAGAGALAGVAVLGNLYEGLGDSILEQTRAYRDGTKSATEVAEALAKGLPIIGGFFSGTQGILTAMAEGMGDLPEFAAARKAVEEVQRGMKEEKKAAEGQKAFDESVSGFERRVNPPKTPEERLRAGYADETRELDDLEAKAESLGSEGGESNANKIREQRKAAEDRLRAGLEEEAEKARQDRAQEKRAERANKTRYYAAQQARARAEEQAAAESAAEVRGEREQEKRADRANKTRGWATGQAEKADETAEARRELKDIERELEIRNAAGGVAVSDAAFANLRAGVSPDNETAKILKERTNTLLETIARNTGSAKPAVTT